MNDVPGPGHRPAYPWPNGKRWAFAMSVDVDGETPLLWRLRGQPIVNITELEQRRFGPRIGVFRLLDLFDRLGMPATFFVPGYIAEHYPAVVPAITRAGHEVGLHGYLHEYPDELSPDELKSTLSRSAELLATQSGATRFGHRAAGWRVTDALIDTLREMGARYDSSMMANDQPYVYRGLIQLPVHWFWDDSLFFRYAGHSRDSWYPAPTSQVEQVWLDECDGIRAVGGLFVLTVHPWNAGRGTRLQLLDRVLRHVQRHDDVWIASLAAMAEHHQRVACATQTK